MHELFLPAKRARFKFHRLSPSRSSFYTRNDRTKKGYNSPHNCKSTHTLRNNSLCCVSFQECTLHKRLLRRCYRDYLFPSVSSFLGGAAVAILTGLYALHVRISISLPHSKDSKATPVGQEGCRLQVSHSWKALFILFPPQLSACAGTISEFV